LGQLLTVLFKLPNLALGARATFHYNGVEMSQQMGIAAHQSVNE